MHVPVGLQITGFVALVLSYSFKWSRLAGRLEKQGRYKDACTSMPSRSPRT